MLLQIEQEALQPMEASTETAEYIKNLLAAPKPSGRPRGRPKNKPIEADQAASSVEPTSSGQKWKRGRPKKTAEQPIEPVEQPNEAERPIDMPIQETASTKTNPYNLRKR